MYRLILIFIMNKNQLIKEVSRETGNPIEAVKEVVNTFLKKVSEATLSEGKVVLSEFGTFKKHVSKERIGRNPSTGAPLQIASKTTIKFKQSESL